MDEQGNNTRKVAISAAICVALSVMLSRLSLGSLLYNLPLLLFVPKIRKTGYAVLTFAVSLILIGLLLLWEYRSYIGTGFFGIIVYGLVFQVMSSVGAAVWTGLRNYSDSVLRKLVICSIPVMVIGVTFSLWLTMPSSEFLVQTLVGALTEVFPVEAFGVDAGLVSQVFTTVLTLLSAPIGLVFSSFPILISEFILKKNDEKWQFDFANMKMPDYYIWFFMGFWAVALLGNLIDSMPVWVTVISWNLALGLSLHYFLSGISVLTSVLRRKSATLTASRVFVPIVIAAVIPGINAVVLTALVVLGAVETWVKLR